MNAEILVAKQALELIRRNPSKLPTVIGLYLVSLKDNEIGSVGRQTYFFMRHIDDILDGELKLPNVDLLSHVGSLRSQVESGIYDEKSQIAQLAKSALNGLDKKKRIGDDPKQDFLNEIDAMVFDYDRSKKRKVLTSEQLNNYYQQIFSPINNLMLIGLGSKLRAKDIPEMSSCQGRIYSIEHLQFDWNTGVINMPEEILNQTKLTSQSPYQEVIKSPFIKSWIKRELKECEPKLESLRTKFNDSSEKLTFSIYNRLINVMLKVVK